MKSLSMVDIFFELPLSDWGQIATIVVGIGTIILTIIIVRESIKMRIHQNTPEISMYLEFAEASPSLLYLVVENIGLGTAKDVRFDITTDFSFYKHDSYKLSGKPFFKKGINNFYPRQKFKYLLGDTSERWEEVKDESLIINVEYFGVFKHKYQSFCDLPITTFLSAGKMTPPETYLGRISYELEGIKKILKDINDERPLKSSD